MPNFNKKNTQTEKNIFDCCWVNSNSQIITMENLNLILLLCAIAAPCLAFLAYSFTRRKIFNQSLNIKRKRLLIFLGIFISIEILILSVIGFLICDNIEDFIIFLKETFGTKGAIAQIIVFVLIFCYAFFRKEKVENEETT